MKKVKQTTKLLASIFEKNIKVLKYFNDFVRGNDEKTIVKYGFSKYHFSITFFTQGVLEDITKKNSLEYKIRRFLNNDDEMLDYDFLCLNEYLSTMKKPFNFSLSPYLKINENPEIHAFSISINHNEYEKRQV